MTFQPLSAYSRIDQNRRATVGLLLVFGVLLVPVLAFLTAYLGVWLLIYLLPDFTPRGWALAQFGAMSILLGLTLWRVFYLRDTLAERLGAVPVPPGRMPIRAGSASACAIWPWGRACLCPGSCSSIRPGPMPWPAGRTLPAPPSSSAGA